MSITWQRLLVFMTVTCARTAGGGFGRTIRIAIATPAYFGTDSLTSTRYMEPAFTTGLALMRKNYPELDVSQHVLTDRNVTDCQGQLGTVQDLLAQWYYRQLDQASIPVILTAGCLEVDHLNHFAREWDILLLTSAIADDITRNKIQSRTWITNTPLPSNYMQLYSSLLLRYNWTSIVVIVDHASPTVYQYLAKVVSGKLKEQGLRVTSWSLSASAVLSGDEISIQLSGLRQFCRVVLYYGTAKSFRRFLIAASDMKMTDGSFVYLVAQPFSHPLFGSFTWQSSEDRQNDEPLPYLSASHIIFQLLGQVLRDIVQSSSNYTHLELVSGRRLADGFLNKTFVTDTGNMTISPFGLRLTSVSLQQFNQTSSKLEVFLISSENENASVTWQQVQPVTWFGRTQFPPNEPYCGYLGQAFVCQAKGSLLVPAATVGSFLLIFCCLITGLAVRMIRNHRKSMPWWNLDPLLMVVI